MGLIVAIMGMTGIGKTTSLIIGPDGSIPFTKNKFDESKYKGMDPDTHFIINCDGKPLPFPPHLWNKDRKNVAEVSSFDGIKKCLDHCAKSDKIKTVSIDTLNGFMSFKEFNDRKSQSFDKWADLANQVIEINSMCSKILREDQIAYIFGHTMLQTMPNGQEVEVMSVIGQKLRRTPPENFYTFMLGCAVEYGMEGDNKHFFLTKANGSTVKTPLGCFAEYQIPNSLKLVDDSVREYYGLK